MEEWQTSWNNSIGNNLLDIKPTIGEYQSVVRNIRKEEVILARLHLGHTRVTHSYLLQGEEQPQCVGCDAPFTIRHFLLECCDFAHVRNNCFHVDNMKELFQDKHDIFKTNKSFYQNLIAIFKIMFCFTFVSDYNTDF